MPINFFFALEFSSINQIRYQFRLYVEQRNETLSPIAIISFNTKMLATCAPMDTLLFLALILTIYPAILLIRMTILFRKYSQMSFWYVITHRSRNNDQYIGNHFNVMHTHKQTIIK